MRRAACVCRKWRYTIRNPNLWGDACLRIWQSSGAEANYRIVQSLYEWFLEENVDSETKNSKRWYLLPKHLHSYRGCRVGSDKSCPCGMIFIIQQLFCPAHAALYISIVCVLFMWHGIFLQLFVLPLMYDIFLHLFDTHVIYEVNDHGDYMLRIVEGWEEHETHDPDVPAISHSRGLTPFVFVPFE
ncbi:unnamed protein product [Musa hybrid cultivar]